MFGALLKFCHLATIEDTPLNMFAGILCADRKLLSKLLHHSRAVRSHSASPGGRSAQIFWLCSSRIAVIGW